MGLTADSIDSLCDDWTISDDGIDRGYADRGPAIPFANPGRTIALRPTRHTRTRSVRDLVGAKGFSDLPISGEESAGMRPLPYDDAASLFGDIASAVSSAVSTVVKPVSSAVTTVAQTATRVIASPVHLASDIARGRNVLASVSDTVKRDLASAKTLAPYAQAVLSVVPVAGQGVNAAIAAGAALAQGQPISSALVAGVKGMIPGGPLAQDALQAAYNVARGQNVTTAAIEALKSRYGSNPAVQAAINTGTALAHGENLQKAALGALRGGAMSAVQSSVPGFLQTLSPLGTRALSGVGPMLASAQKTALSLLPSGASTVAQALMKNPALRSLPIADLAKRLHVPEIHVRDGMASLVGAVAKAGGSKIPGLVPAPRLSEMLSRGTTFDQAIARHASHAAKPALSHNMRLSFRKIRREIRWHKGATGRLAQVVLTTNARGFDDAGAFSGVLKQGMVSPEVGKLQGALQAVAADNPARPRAGALGTSLTKDPSGWNHFGPLTLAAVKEFQAAMKLTADGIAGAQTNAALDRELARLGFGDQSQAAPAPVAVPITPEPALPMPNPIAVAQAVLQKVSDVVTPPPPPTVALPASTPAASPQVATVATYLVTSKDTRGLWGIAQDYTGSGARWKELAAANPQVKPPNYVIHAGDVLTLPSSWGVTPVTPTAQPTSSPPVGAPAGTPISTNPAGTPGGGTTVITPNTSAPLPGSAGASVPQKAGASPVLALGLVGAVLAATQGKIF